MLDSDIKTYLSAVVSSDSTNGGRRSTNEVISGVVTNVLPHVTKAQRLAGDTLMRKLFTIGESSAVEDMIATYLRMFRPTAGEDWVVAFNNTVTKDNTQAAWSPSRYFGSAWLQSDVAAGSSTFTVTADESGLYADADNIVITDKATPDAVSGNSEEHVISGAPTEVANGDKWNVTITIAGTLANPYTVTGETFVASLISFGDVGSGTSNYVITSAGTGDYDYASYPIITDQKGTVNDELVFTFTDATHFTCTGTLSGINYGSGDTSTDFSPPNPDTSTPYFTLEAAGWSGTWAGADTLEADIDDAAFTYVIRRTVPAACASLAGNLATTVTDAESES